MEQKLEGIEHLKSKRRHEMITAAKTVFCKNGIEQSKMTDVAEAAQVGVASVYRYFKTKTELAIAVAISVWEDEMGAVINNIMTKEFHALDGLSQVEHLLNFFLVVHQEHREFIQYIHEFDSFIIRHQLTPDQLAEYEKNILVINQILMESIKKGQRDGSIREDIVVETYYMTICHSFISLSQKLTCSGKLLTFDEQTGDLEQLEMLKEMAVNYLIKK